MKKMFNAGTVINYGSGSGSDFLTSYGSGSTSQKVTVPTVPVPVPQHWFQPPHKKLSYLIRFSQPWDKKNGILKTGENPR